MQPARDISAAVARLQQFMRQATANGTREDWTLQLEKRSIWTTFHVRYEEYRALVGIEPLELREGRLPPRVLGLVMEWVRCIRPS